MTHSANDNTPALTRWQAQQAADIVIRDFGSVWAFTGQTDAGRAFLRDEVQSEGWQWHGSNLMVDHRPAHGLYDHIAETAALDTFLI